MNVIIDGIEYQPVEQKVDKEREEFINDVYEILRGKTIKNGIKELYSCGYIKAGPSANEDRIDEILRSYKMSYDAKSLAYRLLELFNITEKY